MFISPPQAWKKFYVKPEIETKETHHLTCKSLLRQCAKY